jgi:predicted RNA binding protein YcfA (HicA-like mRNA interferase family)
VKLPRNVHGDQLVRALNRLGYVVVRQTGSHVRLKYLSQLPVTVPIHKPLKVGTLASILDDVAVQTELTREEILERMAL